MMITQQKAVYAAERAVPVGRSFDSIAAIQDVLDRLRDEDWWDQGIARVEVGPAAHGQAGVGWYEADKNAGRIELSPECRNERIMCHELAHVFAERCGSKAHDPCWARIYTNIVYRVMGPTAWQALVMAFKEHGVDYG